jgi:predicted nucleotidyltransferase
VAKGKVVKVVEFLARELRARGLTISKIILFGSQARGKATAESDIDIVIVSEDFRGKDIFERVELIKGAEVATIKKFVVPVDILLLTPEELESQSSLIAGYARAGEVLHAA